MTTSRSEVALAAAAPDEATIQRIVATIDRETVGLRHVDIAHALMRMLAVELVRDTATVQAANHNAGRACKYVRRLVAGLWSRRQQ